jgi:hypothetical protein
MTADEHEYRAGAFSGIVAGIMVIALTIMAFVSLGPNQSEPLRLATISLPDAPPTAFRP